MQQQTTTFEGVIITLAHKANKPPQWANGGYFDQMKERNLRELRKHDETKTLAGIITHVELNKSIRQECATEKLRKIHANKSGKDRTFNRVVSLLDEVDAINRFQDGASHYTVTIQGSEFDYWDSLQSVINPEPMTTERVLYAAYAVFQDAESYLQNPDLADFLETFGYEGGNLREGIEAHKGCAHAAAHVLSMFDNDEDTFFGYVEKLRVELDEC